MGRLLKRKRLPRGSETGVSIVASDARGRQSAEWLTVLETAAPFSPAATHALVAAAPRASHRCAIGVAALEQIPEDHDEQGPRDAHPVFGGRRVEDRPPVAG